MKEGAGCGCLYPWNDEVPSELKYTPLVTIETKVKKEKRIKVDPEEEIVLSPETETLLESHRATCFLCGFILDDFKANGKLTGWPLDSEKKEIFPVEAKLKHINLEKGVH